MSSTNNVERVARKTRSDSNQLTQLFSNLHNEMYHINNWWQDQGSIAFQKEIQNMRGQVNILTKQYQQLEDQLMHLAKMIRRADEERRLEAARKLQEQKRAN